MSRLCKGSSNAASWSGRVGTDRFSAKKVTTAKTFSCELESTAAGLRVKKVLTTVLSPVAAGDGGAGRLVAVLKRTFDVQAEHGASWFGERDRSATLGYGSVWKALL